ncbi:MAG: ATP-binding protein [Actinomycetota bacterium]
MSASGLVTILFTDLVGSTDLTSQLGDVVADELRHHHFDDLRGAITATGGTEVKTIGDAIMVSYPSAADALTGAVAMQRSVERRNRRLEHPPLAMRIGVSAGDAAFEDGDWFGTPVIEASRLCAAAEGGQILVSDLVRALAGSRSDVELTRLGERELKGLPEPIAICEVGWTAEAESDEPRVPLPGFVETAPTFPFAGRVVERETLITAWKQAAAGTRRVVLVSGEPGVGKTRLVTELVKTAHEQGALLLWGRCAEELDAPYQPFAEALRHYVHSVPSERLRGELGPLGGEMTRLIPDLTHLVPDLAEPIHTEAETERHRLFEAVSDLLEAVSATMPIVLVLDDVHWADKPSLLLLRHVLRRPAAMPLLILATYRDTDLDRTHPLSEVLADLRREPGVERLDLQGLDSDEVTAFMEHAAGHALEPSGLELAAAVHQETQGNPFFIGEMLLHLAESGLIVHREGRWESDFTLAEVGIPEGIREVVGRRLSRLSDTANVALSIGAVIGPEFDADLIAVLADQPRDDILDALDAAARASIVREVAGTFGRYAFAHALVRSTLYEELSTNRRVRMHAKVAEAIEARYATDLDAHLDALSHHFGEGALAGDPAKAVEYARRAARKAVDDLAFEAAARHLDRALSALELAATADAALRFDVLLDLGNALRAASDARHRDVTFEAAAVARSMGDHERLAIAAVSMTSVMSSRGGVLDPEVIGLLEEALAGIGEEPSGLRAQLMSSLAVELFWGPEKSRQQSLSREALAMARKTGDAGALKAALLTAYARVDGSTPFLQSQQALNLEAIELVADDPAASVYALRGGLAFAAALGQRAEMEAHLAALLATAEGLRQPRYLFLASADEATVNAFLGRLDAAESQILSAMTTALSHGVPDDLVMGPVGAILYMVRRAQGRVGELVPAIEDLVRTQPGAPVWRVALAGALSESGQAELAVEHTHFLADDGCANVPPDVEYPVTLCGLARLSRTVPLDEQAMQHVYDHLLPFAGTYNWSGTSITDANDHGLAVLSARMGDFAASDAHFAAALALAERAGAMPYLATGHLDWARLLAERGDHARAAEHARAALAIGEELGMDGPHGVVPIAGALLQDL